MKKILSLLVGVIIPVIIVYFSIELYRDNRKREEINKNILAINIEPEIVKMESKVIGNISPLIFGGTHTPLVNHLDAWNKIAESGVTSVRRDFFLEQILPKNISLLDYVNNVSDVQNIEKWNAGAINAAGIRYKMAKERGMQTIGVIDYAPAWLTYSGTSNGVPRDWNVFRDIVKKSYTYFRNDLDYIEAWNEPTYEVFNNISGSNLTMEESYVLLAKNIIQAVREVDKDKNDGKKIKIGGLVADNPDRESMLETILNDEYIKTNLDFISYHTYDHPEPSHLKYISILKKHNLEHLPLFITEWNYDAKERVNNDNKTGEAAIFYTANKLITMIENNIQGANYYMLEPVNFDSPGIGIKYMGFYKWENNKAELLPQAKTWRLMSKSLSLGEGNARRIEVNTKANIRTLGFINANNQQGLVLLNEGTEDTVLRVQFKNLDNKSVKNIRLYYTSNFYDGETPVMDMDIPAENNYYTQSIFIPKQTLVGIILSDDVSIFNNIRYKIF